MSLPGVKAQPSGFTLLEVLAVIALIAILASLILGVSATVQRTAQTTKCSSQLRQIAAAFSGYLADHNNVMPQRFYPIGEHDDGVNYFNLLAPYAGGNTVDKKASVFVCPSHLAAGYPRQPSYGMNWYYDNANITAVDRLSTTIMVAETAGPDGTGSSRADQMSGTPGELAPTRHSGLSNYLFFDGHIEKLDFASTTTMWGTDLGDHKQPPPL